MFHLVFQRKRAGSFSCLFLRKWSYRAGSVPPCRVGFRLEHCWIDERQKARIVNEMTEADDVPNGKENLARILIPVEREFRAGDASWQLPARGDGDQRLC